MDLYQCTNQPYYFYPKLWPMTFKCCELRRLCNFQITAQFLKSAEEGVYVYYGKMRSTSKSSWSSKVIFMLSSHLLLQPNLGFARVYMAHHIRTQEKTCRKIFQQFFLTLQHLGCYWEISTKFWTNRNKRRQTSYVCTNATVSQFNGSDGLYWSRIQRRPVHLDKKPTRSWQHPTKTW